MAIQKNIPLNVPASVAAGTAFSTADVEGAFCTLAVQGTFVATLQLQGSWDGGTTWIQIGSNITTVSITSVATLAPQMRINTSAFTSGTPAAYFCCRQSQQIF